MPFAFLLAMQAAGMVTDYLGKQNQMRMNDLSGKLDQAGIDANIQTSRLQTEEDTLASMKQLRANLGTQLAWQAASGSRSGTGVGVLAMNESVGNFNADQKVRRLNQLQNENALRSNKLISGMHTQTYDNTQTNQFRQDIFNKLPTSPEAWNKLSQGVSAKNNYGFTKVGG